MRWPAGSGLLIDTGGYQCADACAYPDGFGNRDTSAQCSANQHSRERDRRDASNCRPNRYAHGHTHSSRDIHDSSHCNDLPDTLTNADTHPSRNHYSLGGYN
jgi:hypothetical protein